jgi:hypothetical protein
VFGRLQPVNLANAALVKLDIIHKDIVRVLSSRVTSHNRSVTSKVPRDLDVYAAASKVLHAVADQHSLCDLFRGNQSWELRSRELCIVDE